MLLQKDYKGEKIIFLASGVNETANSEILYNEYVDGQEGQLPEVVNDALRERANMLYEQYGLVIEEKYIYDSKRHHGDTLAEAVLSGEKIR